MANRKYYMNGYMMIKSYDINLKIYMNNDVILFFRNKSLFFIL